MYELPFLKDVIIIFGIAVGVVFLFRKLHQSHIVGYILTGAIVGPYGLSLIENTSQVEQLADAGVVLLLFTIGLEFSPSKLSRNRATILSVGGAQVIATWIAVGFVAHRFGGLGLSSSALIGFAVALSSTAIVLKLLSERGEVDSAHERISIGILLLQDLFVVPVMVALPMLAGSAALAFGSLLVALLKAAFIVALIFIFSRYALCPFFYQIVKLRSRELFIITALFMCLGAAWLTARFGLTARR